jgi:diaminopimelate decarboxylase
VETGVKHFHYQDGELLCESVPVAGIAAETGTPVYVYTESGIRDNVAELADAFAGINPLICYAIKANYSLAICKVMAEAGTGFDIVSGGELFRALKVGGDQQKIVYAGVGKTRREIEDALRADILGFNVESDQELQRILAVAEELGTEARVLLRVNPNIDAGTHQHTTTGVKTAKFGIDFDTARELAERLKGHPHGRFLGLHVHLGSPIRSPEPYAAALDRLLDLIDGLRSRGIEVEYLDVGGGYGIEYQGGETARPADYAKVIVPAIRKSGCKAILEPGRFLVGECGVLLTRVEYVKRTPEKTFVICDAGMNDLIRPAMYDAYHRIWPVKADKPLPYGQDALEDAGNGRVRVDVVGPVCETGDFFAKARLLPPVQPGDLLAIFAAGAYGFSMSSNYNSRPRACEVMVCSDSPRLVRERESYEAMIASERL